MAFMFQFPFRRDELCNQIEDKEETKKRLFQFPFRRDELCNIVMNPWDTSEPDVSIPFSSG